MQAEVGVHLGWGGPEQALVRGFALWADVSLGLGIKTLNHKIFSNFLTSFIPLHTSEVFFLDWNI